MTIAHDSAEPGFGPVDDPARLPTAFATAFNAGRADALERLYEDHAVLVPAAGQPAHGPGIGAALRHLLGFGLPMDASARHVYTAGDIALLIVDWSISGTGPDGTPLHLAGSATDVARRGGDGRWRYVVDNPSGTA